MIPDSVTSIGDEAFVCCSLKNVSLPKHLEGNLPDNAFEGDSKITYRAKSAAMAAPKVEGGKEKSAPAKKPAAKGPASKKPAAKKAVKKTAKKK